MGWKAITEDNVEYIEELERMGVPIMYAKVEKNGEVIYGDDLWYYPKTMAKRGGYYFFAIPNLYVVKNKPEITKEGLEIIKGWLEEKGCRNIKVEDIELKNGCEDEN